MTAHEYLSQYLALQADIERWKRVFKELAGDEYEDWIISNGANLTSKYSDMPSSGQKIDRVASAGSIMAHKDYEREKYARESIQKARDTQLKIVHAIDAVPFNQARQALDLKYLQGYDVLEISELWKCSEKTVRRTIAQGLGWTLFSDLSTNVPESP